MGIGSLAKLGISKGMSLGRELFGFLLRSDLNVAKIAEWAGITMDTLKDAPPEALSAILERAARSGAIDPREANNINIQLAKEAQEAMPAMPTLKAQDAANKLSKQFGVNFDVSNHPTAYGNSTYVSGRISGPGRTNVRVGFRLSDHETGDLRKATDDFLTIIDDGNVSAESLVAEVQSQIERALPKMQKISDDREAKTIAQSDALSRWSELSGDERGEIAVKFNETRPTRFNNVPWKNLTKQQKADFAVDGPLAKEAQEVAPDPITVYHASPNKIEGAFRPSNRDVGIHFAGNPDLATNAAVKSFVDNFDSAENVKPYKFSINASPDQIADIPSVGGRFDFYDILEGLVSSKKITDETFKEIYDGLESIEQSGDYYDEIMEAQNNYFTEKLSGENNIKVLKYFNDFDAGPTWKDMEAGIFESGVKPDYSYMVLDPDIIGEAGIE
jgi:hypothetical protein